MFRLQRLSSPPHKITWPCHWTQFIRMYLHVYVRIKLMSLLFSSPTVSTSTSASSNSFSTSDQVCNPLPRPLTGFTTTNSLRGRAPNSAHVSHRDRHKCLQRQTFVTTKHSFSTCAHTWISHSCHPKASYVSTSVCTVQICTYTCTNLLPSDRS